MHLETFSKRLREMMDWEDVSTRALSIAIGADRKSVRGWLQGKYFPRWDALIKLANYFKVSLDYLVGLDEKDLQETVNDVTMDENKASFLRNLKTFMEREGLTIYAVAKGAQVGQKPVKNWLVKGSMPETSTLIRLSKMMGCRLDRLLGRK